MHNAVLLQALEAAREKDDVIKDEIWRELARVKYSHWQQDAAARKAERCMLRQQLDQMLSERHGKELQGSVSQWGSMRI